MAGIAGVAYIKVDGKQYTLAGSMTIALARVSREGLVGLSGVAGYKETPRVPFIEVELYADENTDLEDIGNITEATVQAELADGRVGLLRDAWQAGDLELNAAEGTTTVRFEGKSGEWIDA